MNRHPQLFSWLIILILYLLTFLFILINPCGDDFFETCFLAKTIFVWFLLFCFIFFLFLTLIILVFRRLRPREKTPAEKFRGTLIRGFLSLLPIWLLFVFAYLKPTLTAIKDRFLFYPATRQSEKLGAELITITNLEVKPSVDSDNNLQWLELNFAVTLREAGEYLISAPQNYYLNLPTLESPINPVIARQPQKVNFQSGETKNFSFWYKPPSQPLPVSQLNQTEGRIFVWSVKEKHVPFSIPLPEVALDYSFILTPSSSVVR